MGFKVPGTGSSTTGVLRDARCAGSSGWRRWVDRALSETWTADRIDVGQDRADDDEAAEERDRRPGPRPAGWAFGLPALALLVLVSGLHVVPELEGAIRREANRASQGESGPGLARYRARAEVDGRDVAIVADLGLADETRRRAEESVARIPGVRSVRTEVAAPVAMQPFTFSVRWTSDGLRLSGGVPSAEDRARLVDLAAAGAGAERVDDRLRLGTGAPEGFVDAAAFLIAALRPVGSGDATLTERRFTLRATAPDAKAYRDAMAALSRPPAGFTGEIDIVPPLAEPFTWSVRREPGAVVLAGSVPSEAVRAELVRLAAGILPDVPVQDAMETARGLDRGIDLALAARRALLGLARLRAGRAELVGRRFSFAGEGVAKDALAAIEAEIRAGLPSGVEVGSIAVRAVPATPFLFSARRAAGTVDLAGYVPDEATRRAAVEAAGSRFPGERIRDRTVVADGAPPGFADALRSGLSALADIAEGEAAIRDRELRIGGRVLYPQLAARLRRTFPREAPSGWTAAAALEPVVADRAIDPIQCGDLLADSARDQPIRFEPGKPSLAGPAGEPGLAATADLVRRCGRVTIRVVHHAPAAPDAAAARDLASARAATVAAALSERGATARLLPDGAVAAGSGPERTEFLVSTP